MRYFVTLGAREVNVDVTPLPGGGFSVTVDGESTPAEVAPAGRALSIRIGGRVFDLVLEGDGADVRFSSLGSAGRANIESEQSRRGVSVRRGGGAGVAHDVVSAPMPGRIVRILVASGQNVEAGVPLIVIEAMKMENELRSSRSGTIAEIMVGPGDTVEGGAKLLRYR